MRKAADFGMCFCTVLVAAQLLTLSLGLASGRVTGRDLLELSNRFALVPLEPIRDFEIDPLLVPPGPDLPQSQAAWEQLVLRERALRDELTSVVRDMESLQTGIRPITVAKPATPDALEGVPVVGQKATEGSETLRK